MLEVAANGLERVSLLLDLGLRAKSQAAKDRKGRTPTLHRMLEEESAYDRGKNEKSPVDKRPQAQAN